MTTPFVGQIIMFAGNFTPQGWAVCDGSLLPMAQYQALYAKIGTIYGGDGESTFALPDLRGRVPIGEGQGRGLSNYVLSETVGAESVVLAPAQIPPHSHPVSAAAPVGNANVPASNAVLSGLGGQAASGEFQVFAYAPPGHEVTLHGASVGPAGGGQPHANIQPYQAINYCIALTGN